jgi:hypothetical protein
VAYFDLVFQRQKSGQGIDLLMESFRRVQATGTVDVARVRRVL